MAKKNENNDDIRIGVFICHCGTNIAGVVDPLILVDYASTLPGVAFATDYRFMCSDPGQDLIKQKIDEEKPKKKKKKKHKKDKETENPE